MAEENKVEGFTFSDPQELAMAKKEAAAIGYIQEQMNGKNIQTILQLYNQVIEQRLFQTVVGEHFLLEVHEYLMMNPDIIETDVLPVYAFAKKEEAFFDREGTTDKTEKQTEPVENAEPQKQAEKRKQSKKIRVDKDKNTIKKGRNKKEIPPEEQLKKTKTINLYLKIVIVLLVAVIGGMFYILQTSDSPTILNYETKLVNKYATWEEKLDEREAKLKEKENALAKEKKAVQADTASSAKSSQN